MNGMSEQFRKELADKRMAALRALRDYSNLLAQLTEEQREHVIDSRAGRVLRTAAEKIFGQMLPLL